MRRNPLKPADVIVLPTGGILIKADALDRYLGVKESAKRQERARAAAGQQKQNEAAKAALLQRFS